MVKNRTENALNWIISQPAIDEGVLLDFAPIIHHVLIDLTAFQNSVTNLYSSGQSWESFSGCSYIHLPMLSFTLDTGLGTLEFCKADDYIARKKKL